MEFILWLIVSFLLVALVFVVVVGGAAVKSTQSGIEDLARKNSLGSLIANIGGRTLQYLGGHPMHPNPSESSIISIRERGFVISVGGKGSALTYAHLKHVQFMSHEQVSRDVTLTRLVTLGLLAFAAKKKTVTTERYLKLTLELQGVESQVLFKTPDAGRIAGLLNQGRVNVAYTPVPKK